MKYILPFFLLLILGCNSNKNNVDNKNKSTKTERKIQKIKSKGERKPQEIVIRLNDINLTFRKNKLIYPEKKVVILFENNNSLSILQKAILNKLKVKYYDTNITFLVNYFKIKLFPTIVVLDKNKTIKYENFVPYEILKAEGF